MGGAEGLLKLEIPKMLGLPGLGLCGPWWVYGSLVTGRGPAAPTRKPQEARAAEFRDFDVPSTARGVVSD